MKFYDIFKSYFSENGITGFDKVKLLIHYPLFRMMRSLDYGKPVEKKTAQLFHGLFRNYRIKHKVKSVVPGIFTNVHVPFDRYGLNSFLEMLVTQVYRPPFEMLDVGTIVDLGGSTGMASLYFLTKFHAVRKVLVVEANPGLIETIKFNLRDFQEIMTIKNNGPVKG